MKVVDGALGRGNVGVWLGASAGLLLALGAVACGDDSGTSSGGGGTGASTTTSSGKGGAGGDDDPATTSGSGGDTTTATGTGGATTTTGTGGAGSTTTGAGGGSATDPTVDGPVAYADLPATTFTVPGTDSTVEVTGAAPTSGGPYPVVIIGHGFQLPTSQYLGYARRLASHGFVALLPDYPAGLTDPADHLRNARDLEGTLDWALTSNLADRIDPTRAGVMGHSLGGKAAVLAASEDDRFGAVLGLDPVDTIPDPDPLPDFPGCENFGPCCAVVEGEDRCPDASALAGGLGIPSAFLGETLDGASGGFGGACAPTADNYATFYASAAAPSYQVTVTGAGHMSFLDDLGSCGFTCSACQTPTADNATVNGLAKAYATAFFLRHLTQEPAFDAWLIGADAQASWVDTGQATISSK